MLSLMALKLYFWWFRLTHDHPCKEEVLEALSRRDLKVVNMTRGQYIALFYGISPKRSELAIQAAAEKYEVTRERVRQILLKTVRTK
jgi:DNA-directed RNA polymerase sigma subunit (sigma70/sigma32)